MKSFKQFREEMGVGAISPTNNVGSGEIAGYSPLIGFVRRKKPLKRKSFSSDKLGEEKKFMGYRVFDVDSDTFFQRRFGRRKYSRWRKELNDCNNELITYGKQTKKPIIISDKSTGVMSFYRK
jgi:hypothetical protein